MKFFLLSIFISLFFIAEVAAFAIQQTNYRWRNDDGNQATATWKANENVPVAYAGTDALRLRLQSFNNSSISVFNDEISLYYSTASNSFPWIKVTNNINNAFVVTTSAFVNNLDPTAEQLTAPLLATFTPGFVSTSFDQLINHGTEVFSEFEWVIQPTINAVPDIYFFKFGWELDFNIETETFSVTAVADGENPAILYYQTPIAAVPLQNWAAYISAVLLLSFVVYRFYKRV